MSTITIPGTITIRNASVRLKKNNGDIVFFEIVNDVFFTIEPFNPRGDAFGRTTPSGYRVACQFNSMPSDRLSVQFYLDLISSDETYAYAMIDDLRGNHLWLRSVKPVIDYKVDGNGKPSKFKFLFDRVLKNSEMALITTNPEL